MIASPKPWQLISLPETLAGMRSMLSYEEKQYLIWSTAEKFEGWGAVVDLGPWLGSSSAALAEGLKRQGRRDKVQSFDLFKWESEPSYMHLVADEPFKGGDDFLPLFLREIGAYGAWVEPHQQDLMHYAWPGGPIEILFVDAAKSWELTNAIIAGFGAQLVAGRSRVILQDFRHSEAPWLPLIFDSRPDLWQEIESVEDGTTVTFMPLKPLHGLAGIQSDYSEHAFPLASVERLLRARISSESPLNARLIRRTLYRKLLSDGSAEAVGKLRDEILASGVTATELSETEDHWTVLVPQGWKAFDRQDYRAARTLAERCLHGKELRPFHAVALLGKSLLQLGDLAGARNCFDEVRTGQPDFLPARLYGAELALAEGRFEEAEAEALGLLAEHNGEGGVMLIEHIDSVLVPLGWRAHSRHEYQRAKQLAERCLTGNGARPVHAVALLGQSLLALGDFDGARRCVDEVVSRAPSFLPGKLYRAELALAEDRRVDAETDALQVLESSAGDETLIKYALQVLEQTWNGTDRTDHALRTLTRLRASLSESAAFRASLARTQAALGLQDGAPTTPMDR